MQHHIHRRQQGRFTLLAALIYTAGAIGLVLTGYWMGQQSHRELAGVIEAPPAKPAEPANAQSIWPISDDKPKTQKISALHGRWHVVDATHDTPLRDVEFFADNRVELRDGEGSSFIGEYSVANGRLTINAPATEGGNVLFEGSYSVVGERMTITHDDVVVTLLTGPAVDSDAPRFMYDQRSRDLEDIEKISIRTDDEHGCRSELAEAFRDEDFDVVGEGIADAVVAVRIERQPMYEQSVPISADSGWRFYYSASLLGHDDISLFEFEEEVEEETEAEACEELAEVIAEEVYDVID